MEWEAFLASVSQQVQTLNILDSFHTPRTLLYETIRLLLRHGSPGVLKTLRIKRPNSDEYADLGDLVGQSDPILRSITVLHLNDVVLPWTSVAYHNLMDLRLQFSEAEEREISTSQLVDILGASPGLTTLKLDYITITTSDNWNAKNAVRLAHLE
ncbi:hypothetical protein FRC09_011403, partial [Ceratobasidium sp. 395]